MARESIKLSTIARMTGVIKFVGVFETLEPGLCKLLRDKMDEIIEADGKEMAYKVFGSFFASPDDEDHVTGLNVLQEWHWLRPYCELYIKNYKIKR